MSQRLTHKAIQSLLLKRFTLAAGTYGPALLLLWLAIAAGDQYCAFSRARQVETKHLCSFGVRVSINEDREALLRFSSGKSQRAHCRREVTTRRRQAITGGARSWSPSV